MVQSITKTVSLIAIAVLMLMNGCDNESGGIAREAADRQAQQNTEMAEVNRTVASGTQRLVEADAQARKEVFGVHRDLQSERSRLDGSWNALEEERQLIAGQRRRESIWVPVVQTLFGIAMTVVLLGFSWHALASARGADSADSELTELVVCQILPDTSPLLSGGPHDSAVLSQSEQAKPTG